MTASIDPSRRFILPEDAPYLRNMAALWAADPGLARKIEAIDDEGYAVEKSKAGEPTLAIDTADGRKISLHSRHHPIDEAKRLIDAVDFEKAFAFSLHGLGLGYHLEIL